MAKQKKHQDKGAPLPTKPAGGIALAANWPLYEVLLSRGWEGQAALITILVARRSLQSGKIAAGLFLVDLACLGVKSAQVKLFKFLHLRAGDPSRFFCPRRAQGGQRYHWCDAELH
jgi:hypothetical protein